MCEHIDAGIPAFEISHEQGKQPMYICRICKEQYTQQQAIAILEGWQ